MLSKKLGHFIAFTFSIGLSCSAVVLVYLQQHNNCLNLVKRCVFFFQITFVARDWLLASGRFCRVFDHIIELKFVL